MAVKTILERMRNPSPQFERWILALLSAILLGQLFFSPRRVSQTADEATHLYSGYRYLVCGDLTISPEHPPLAKMIAALPILPMNVAANCEMFPSGDLGQAYFCLNWLYSQDWRSALARARFAISVFALALCLLVWMSARRMFGFATAIMATVLLVFEPNVLAFGPLVLTDVPVTCMLLFAVYAFYLWVTRRTAPWFLLTGLATGLTLLAKLSGVLVLPILGMLAVADAVVDRTGQTRLRKAARNLVGLAVIFCIAYAVVWVGYGMHFAAHPGAVQFPESQAISTSGRILNSLKHYHLLPEAYLEGFGSALAIANDAAPTFIAGKTYLHTPWFASLVYVLIRSTAAMLVLLLVAVPGVAIQFRERMREFVFLLAPAGVFLAICIRSNLVGGIRYLLPALPFLLIAASSGCVELARHWRWVGYAVAALLVLHVASSLHAFPNYLSYANEFWGGPANAYKYVGWVDGGQAYWEAKAYLERHPANDCWFITGWQWDPGLYGIPCHSFGNYLPTEIPPRLHGTVIVSSTLLTGGNLVQDELAKPFKKVAPRDKIGGSALLVYEGDFDTSFAAAVGEVNLATNALRTGQPQAALLHANRAVELAPDSAHARGFLCLLLTDLKQSDAALRECRVAQSLVLQDPLRDEPLRKNVLESVNARLVLLISRYGAANGNDAGPALSSDPK